MWWIIAAVIIAVLVGLILFDVIEGDGIIFDLLEAIGNIIVELFEFD